MSVAARMAADGPLAVSFKGELWLVVFEVAVGFGRSVMLVILVWSG